MNEESMETDGGPSTPVHPTQSVPFAPTPSPAYPLADSLPLASDEPGETLYISPYSPQVSMATYNIQAHHYTQQALRDLKASPEYQKHTMKCKSCGSSWYNGCFSLGCKECSGFALYRPCPVCDGRCDSKWQRNVDMSHSTSEAHWDGTCSHTDAAKLLEDLIHMDNVTSAMRGLGTHQQ